MNTTTNTTARATVTAQTATAGDLRCAYCKATAVTSRTAWNGSRFGLCADCAPAHETPRPLVAVWETATLDPGNPLVYKRYDGIVRAAYDPAQIDLDTARSLLGMSVKYQEPAPVPAQDAPPSQAGRPATTTTDCCIFDKTPATTSRTGANGTFGLCADCDAAYDRSLAEIAAAETVRGLRPDVAADPELVRYAAVPCPGDDATPKEIRAWEGIKRIILGAEDPHAAAKRAGELFRQEPEQDGVAR